MILNTRHWTGQATERGNIGKILPRRQCVGGVEEDEETGNVSFFKRKIPLETIPMRFGLSVRKYASRFLLESAERD